MSFVRIFFFSKLKEEYLVLQNFKDRALLGIKNNIFAQKKEYITCYLLLNHPWMQKLAQLVMNSGYFPRWHTTHHSFPDPLNFSRWQSSLFGDHCGCQNPHPCGLYKNLIPPGLPDPPILGKTIDRCIIGFTIQITVPHHSLFSDATILRKRKISIKSSTLFLKTRN